MARKTKSLKIKNTYKINTWKFWRKVLLYVLTISLFLIFMFPLYMVVINAAKDAQEIIQYPMALPKNISNIFTNIQDILTRDNVNYYSSFIYSVIITTISLVAIGIFSSMAAWVLVRTKKWYSTAIFLLFIAGMVVPFQVVMLPLSSLLQTLKNITGIPFKDTIHGIVLAYVGFGAPLSIFMFHGFIKSVPIDIEEAAIIDGCSKPQVFFKVILPILKPIFVTMLVLNGMWIWNDYLLPVLILGKGGDIQTLPISVSNLAGFYDKEWGLILTAVVMAALPVVILFLFAQKYIIKGMTSGAIK
ncbi:L-arabinose transport system permease protein AraQ [Candidatus Izimaplasma bacterium HR1]|uniref:carbohydrate ABC transporter permease n=1 Tax=Candidatus Izimoplasma sp. HR1 TaxID=1541959 RepID=UPI0004F7C144|nr:L-arabinose transport system permease protein AraQ [Candidatus Izimaplasma bacterium HR1]